MLNPKPHILLPHYELKYISTFLSLINQGHLASSVHDFIWQSWIAWEHVFKYKITETTVSCQLTSDMHNCRSSIPTTFGAASLETQRVTQYNSARRLATPHEAAGGHMYREIKMKWKWQRLCPCPVLISVLESSFVSDGVMSAWIGIAVWPWVIAQDYNAWYLVIGWQTQERGLRFPGGQHNPSGGSRDQNKQYVIISPWIPTRTSIVAVLKGVVCRYMEDLQVQLVSSCVARRGQCVVVGGEQCIIESSWTAETYLPGSRCALSSRPYHACCMNTNIYEVTCRL